LSLEGFLLTLENAVSLLQRCVVGARLERHLKELLGLLLLGGLVRCVFGQEEGVGGQNVGPRAIYAHRFLHRT
jgi:hypothetical protein